MSVCLSVYLSSYLHAVHQWSGPANEEGLVVVSVLVSGRVVYSSCMECGCCYYSAEWMSCTRSSYSGLVQLMRRVSWWSVKAVHLTAALNCCVMPASAATGR